MNAAKLIAILVELESLAGKGDPIVMRRMILDAQEWVLRIEQQLMAALDSNRALREQLEVCEEFSLLRRIELGDKSDPPIAAHLS